MGRSIVVLDFSDPKSQSLALNSVNVRRSQAVHGEHSYDEQCPKNVNMTFTLLNGCHAFFEPGTVMEPRNVFFVTWNLEKSTEITHQHSHLSLFHSHNCRPKSHLQLSFFYEFRVSVHSNISHVTSKRFSFWSCMRIFKTNFSEICQTLRSSIKINCPELNEIPTSHNFLIVSVFQRVCQDVCHSQLRLSHF